MPAQGLVLVTIVKRSFPCTVYDRFDSCRQGYVKNKNKESEMVPYSVERVSDNPITIRVTLGEGEASRFIGSVSRRTVRDSWHDKDYVWQAHDVEGIIRSVEDTFEEALQYLFDRTAMTGTTSPLLTRHGVGAVGSRTEE